MEVSGFLFSAMSLLGFQGLGVRALGLEGASLGFLVFGVLGGF